MKTLAKLLTVLIALSVFGANNSGAEAVAAEEFGRLFTSPLQRRALDELRRDGPKVELLAPATLEERTEPLSEGLPTQLQFSGYIKRADGQYVLWVNGISGLSGQRVPIDEAHFSRGATGVSLQTGVYRALMQPGQVWLLQDNTVVEGYLSSRKPARNPSTESEL